MNFFFIFNAKNFKNFLIVVMVALFAALVLYSHSLANVPAFSNSNDPKAIYKGEKGIALTFDIGWGDTKAQPIMQTLQKHGVKNATFFLSGSWAERHPDLVNQMVKQGYEIGSLGYAYKDYTDMKEEEIQQDVMKSQEVFKKLNVKNVKLLRTPTGHFSTLTLKVADQLGLTVVHWSVNSNDWKTPGVNQIIENTSKMKKGDIVLLHASDAATQTNKALPEVINQAKNTAKLTTVSDMISNGKVKTTRIE